MCWYFIALMMNKRMRKIIPPQLKKRKKNPYNHSPEIHCSKLQQMRQEKPAKNKQSQVVVSSNWFSKGFSST
jgi:hypothetical protein